MNKRKAQFRYEMKHELTGLCIRCGNPRSGKSRLCDECKARNKRNVREFRALKLAREQAKVLGTLGHVLKSPYESNQKPVTSKEKI